MVCKCIENFSIINYVQNIDILKISWYISQYTNFFIQIFSGQLDFVRILTRLAQAAPVHVQGVFFNIVHYW